jgi:AGZA family xanthine/uracil permease-like MFS transporter
MGFQNWLEENFSLNERKSAIWTEFRAGLATFLTMCYILLVNPQLLAKVIDEKPETVVVSTAISSAIGCFAAGYFG